MSHTFTYEPVIRSDIETVVVESKDTYVGRVNVTNMYETIVAVVYMYDHPHI